MHFRGFSYGKGTEWGIFFGVAKISNIFLGCLKFLIFFGGERRCWARAYVCRKNESIPPPLGELIVFAQNSPTNVHADVPSKTIAGGLTFGLILL